MRKPECDEIVGKFIEKLGQIDKYDIKPISKKPRIYTINGKKINIRCTTTTTLFYSVDLNVLPLVDYIIYLTSSPLHNPNYFLMFPSEHLNEIIDEMSESKSQQPLKLFNIDWDGCVLILKNGKLVDAMNYAFDLDNPKYYPDFSKL